MPNRPRATGALLAADTAVKQYGSVAAAARALGVPRETLRDTLNAAGNVVPIVAKGRRNVTLHDGIILVGSDAHYHPGPPSTAHRAFVHFCKKLKPKIVIMNGDVLDAATISRHPPINWGSLPTVKEELDVCQERLGEIAKASKDAQRFWPLGNHDARFETRLATVAPEFKDVHGISLQDHFPDWKPCWSVHINNQLVVKHRNKGGANAPANNTLWAGRSMITGHLHSQAVRSITDYDETRFGVDTGCLADIYGPQFEYMEDNPRDWRSGFCVVTFIDGRLLMPELVRVVEDGLVEFRGQLIEV